MLLQIYIHLSAELTFKQWPLNSMGQHMILECDFPFKTLMNNSKNKKKYYLAIRVDNS